MPFYDYVCPDCTSDFSLQRQMSHRDHPTHCPNCDGEHSVRQISMPMVMTRGENGNLRSLSGSSCGSCAATTCNSCGSNN
jgi:putative FmdB family regulatory protein